MRECAVKLAFLEILKVRSSSRAVWKLLLYWPQTKKNRAGKAWKEASDALIWNCTTMILFVTPGRSKWSFRKEPMHIAGVKELTRPTSSVAPLPQKGGRNLCDPQNFDFWLVFPENSCACNPRVTRKRGDPGVFFHPLAFRNKSVSWFSLPLRFVSFTCYSWTGKKTVAEKNRGEPIQGPAIGHRTKLRSGWVLEGAGKSCNTGWASTNAKTTVLKLPCMRMDFKTVLIHGNLIGRQMTCPMSFVGTKDELEWSLGPIYTAWTRAHKFERKSFDVACMQCPIHNNSCTCTSSVDWDWVLLTQLFTGKNVLNIEGRKGSEWKLFL